MHYINETIKPVVISATENKVLLDFERKVTGYLSICLNDNISHDLHISTGPVLECMPYEESICVKEKYCSEKYLAGRYFKIESNSIDMREIADNILLIPSQHSVKQIGMFKCNENVYNKIFDRCAYTMELCVQKHCESSHKRNLTLPKEIREFIDSWTSKYSEYIIMDGPRRDREAWLGDIRTEALSIYATSGDYEVCKSSLDLFLHLQNENGFTCGSAASRQGFREYNLWWIIAIYECYLYSGDKQFLEEFLCGMRKLMDSIISQLDSRCFMFNDGNWMWTIPREGYSSAVQCILYETLNISAKVEMIFNHKNRAEKYRSIAKKLKENINNEFWDETRGIYREDFKLIDTDIPVTSDVNCYAITFGVADYKKSIRILKYLKENMWCKYGSTTLDKKIVSAKVSDNLVHYGLKDYIGKADIVDLMYPHNKQVWPFINAYEVEARFVAGDTAGAMELIELCWGNSLYDLTGTYWEMIDIDNSEFCPRSLFKESMDDCYNSAAHGWSSWVNHLMHKYILGVRPIEAGFKKTIISPSTGTLSSIEGNVPTPYGEIIVKIKKTDNYYLIDVITDDVIHIDISVSKEELNGRVLKSRIVNSNSTKCMA